MKEGQTILIVGAGFVGVRCALDLAKAKKRGKISQSTKIVLINDKDYFEYYPAMYRVVTGSSPVRVCIRLDEIFEDDPVEIIEDRIISIDCENKEIVGKSGSKYQGDYIVMGIGSENAHFGIEGLDELSFNFRSIHNALHLKKRMHEMFENHVLADRDEQLLALHFVIVGGGPSGVELAGELVLYAKKLARKYELDESLVTVDLIERAPRILAKMDERVSKKAEKRLRNLGVNVFTNRELIKNEAWTVLLKDMTIGAKTVIWTAGVKNNSFFNNACKIPTAENGRVIVDDYLQAENTENIFVGGDNANTEYSGMAQTALYDGEFLAKNLIKKLRRKQIDEYVPKPVAYDIPIGPGWGILQIGEIVLYGRFAWWMRRLIDLRFYMSILPFGKALDAFRSKDIS